MERHCKNCNHMLYANHHYCSNCGAKWINNRLTMKQVAVDFGDMYIGLDTKFVRTLKDLCIRPQAVIKGYLFGRRAYYMDAIRYLLLSLFVSGVFLFVMRSSGGLDDYMTSMIPKNITANGSEEMQKQIATQTKVTNWLFDYQGIVVFLTIPILALGGKITFWGKKYFNFTEQLVFYMYTYSHVVMISTPISILLVWLSPKLFTYFSIVTYPAMYLYNAYCYKKCFQLDIANTILRALIGIVVIIVLFLLTIVLFSILGFLTAVIASKIGYDVKGFFDGYF